MRTISRSIILITLFFSFSVKGYSQTQKQLDLVSSFFGSKGALILQDLAHPLNVCKTYDVTVYATNTYKIVLGYTFGSKFFSCEYLLTVDATGHFTNLSCKACHDPDGPCFGACRFANFSEMTTTEDQSKYEKYLDKDLKDMHCEEYTMAKLYIRWVDMNYYEKY